MTLRVYAHLDDAEYAAYRAPMSGQLLARGVYLTANGEHEQDRPDRINLSFETPEQAEALRDAADRMARVMRGEVEDDPVWTADELAGRD